MILLPRGNPVKEKVNPGKVNLPEALDKLRQGKFTGYLRFDFPAGAGIFLFENGCFIEALFESAHDRLLARSAISRIFTEALTLSGSLNIFRVSPDLALLLRGVLHGELLHQGQELELINVRGLLKRVRDEHLNGCLRVYRGGKVALIFYRGGNPLGFFHDGGTELERTADCSRSIATESGAKIDVLSIQVLEEGPLSDLWDTENLAQLWQNARSGQPEGSSAPSAASPSAAGTAGERQTLLLTALSKIAQKYLGAFGVSLAEKEFADLIQGPLDAERLAIFYANLAQAAELVIEADKAEQMLAEMKEGARVLLAVR